MKVVSKITLKQNFLVLYPGILQCIGLLVIMYYYITNQEWNRSSIRIIIIAEIFMLAPMLFLHIQYMIANKNLQCTIDTQDQTIEFKINNSYIYNFNQIVQFDYFATHGHSSKKGSSFYYTFDPYRYYRLEFDDGRIFYLTCLIMNNIEFTLEQLLNKEAEWHFKMLPTLSKKKIL